MAEKTIKNKIEMKIKTNNKEEGIGGSTWLPWCRKNVVHLSANGDQLDDPMILLMPSTLHGIYFVLCVIQLNNFGFLLRQSPFFDGF